MNVYDIQSLISTVDKLIFSHTGEHLDDLETAILEGTFDHQKYADIANNIHRSEKYVKDMAAQLWRKVSNALGEEVNKSNIKSSLQRYYYYNFYNSSVINTRTINKSHICTGLSDNDSQLDKIKLEAKLEAVPELIKEGLTIEKIAKILKLPLEIVEKEVSKFN
ncbi:ATPase [Crocosphaera sp.]|uniref:ATPase n=1 Tax=Crocosphaera sp. TaxID=2729996 RepID=UPI003F1F7F3E|nr:ATPase [Crocosphaera sp.]